MSDGITDSERESSGTANWQLREQYTTPTYRTLKERYKRLLKAISELSHDSDCGCLEYWDEYGFKVYDAGTYSCGCHIGLWKQKILEEFGELNDTE